MKKESVPNELHHKNKKKKKKGMGDDFETVLNFADASEPGSHLFIFCFFVFIINVLPGRSAWHPSHASVNGRSEITQMKTTTTTILTKKKRKLWVGEWKI